MSLGDIILPLVSVLAIASYIFYVRFTTRVSPTIPYAGEESVLSRFRVLGEYGANQRDFLIKQRKKLGDVFCVDLLIFKIVYFLGPESNRTILNAPEKKFSIVENAEKFLGFTPNSLWKDPSWYETSVRDLRTVLNNPEMLALFTSHCDVIADEHFESWSKKPNVPLFQSFSELMIAYGLIIFLGKPFYIKHGAEATSLYKRLFDEVQRDPLLLILPRKLWYLLPSAKEGFRIQDRFRELISPIISEQYRRKKQNLPMDDSMYLGLLCKTHDERYSEHILFQAINVLPAVRVNLAQTISWLFLHANHVPGTLDRLKSEIEEGDYSSAKGLGPYLEACMRETGRLYTLPSVMRVVSRHNPEKHVSIQNHQVPKGTIIAVSPVVTQQDPALFEDPDKWIPERFLADDGKQFAGWFRRTEFVHFGAGTHACIGEKMTRTVLLKNIMETWLQKYKLEIVSGLHEGKGIDGVGIDPDWKSEPLGTVTAEGDVLVKVTKLE